MRKSLFNVLSYLVAMFLVTICDCAKNNESLKSSEITLSGSFLSSIYESGEDMAITATVKNNGNIPIMIEEGRLMAVFIVEGEATTFLQSAKASKSSGVTQIIVEPGKAYKEIFNVHPKD